MTSRAPDTGSRKGKIPRRFKNMAKRGVKFHECGWCGTVTTEKFCTPKHEEAYDEWFGD